MIGALSSISEGRIHEMISASVLGASSLMHETSIRTDNTINKPLLIRSYKYIKYSFLLKVRNDT